MGGTFSLDMQVVVTALLRQFSRFSVLHVAEECTVAQMVDTRITWAVRKRVQVDCVFFVMVRLLVTESQRENSF